MSRTLRNIMRRDRDKFKVPKKVQDILPVKMIWTDGIFLSGRNRYSKMFLFTDINFAVASREDKKGMIEQYAEVINSFDSDCSYKMTINNRLLNRIDFEDDVLMSLLKDKLDVYRNEYNELMVNMATGTNSIVQDKYILIAVHAKNVDDARIQLTRIGGELRGYFSRMGSICRELDANDRLRIIHDFFRHGEESY